MKKKTLPPEEVVLFKDMVGTFKTASDICVFPSLVNPKDKTLGDYFDTLKAFSDKVMDGKPFLTQTVIGKNIYVVFFSNEKEICDIRRIYKTTFKELVYYNYSGLVFICLTEFEVKFLNKKREFLKDSLAAAREKGYSPTLLILLGADTEKLYKYDPLLFNIFGVDTILFVSKESSVWKHSGERKGQYVKVLHS